MDPVELYLEDFENGSGVQELEDYTGVSGVTYDADEFWLRAMRCNGFIVSYENTTQPEGYCNDKEFSWKAVRVMAYAVGKLNPAQNPETNRAIASNTSGNASNDEYSPDGQITPNQREFATRDNLNLPVSNRFVTFSVDVAAQACHRAHPLMRFYLKDAEGVEHPVSSSAINPCADPGGTEIKLDGLTARYGSFSANDSMLMTGGNFGIVMRNEQPETLGNDHAFDNIRVLDVTPQLDKSFSPARVPAGETSTLTFTVTNTSELAAKQGWAFTDTLPEGLVVAPTPNLGGTCDADRSAAAGGSTIEITNGTLDKDQVSCTITVDVTSETPKPSDPSPKVYKNCAANISNVSGMNLPDCAEVEFFTEPKLEIEKTSNATADSRPGDVVNYTVKATNTGTGDYTAEIPAVVFDDLSGVLDDATFNNDASASAGSEPSFADPLLSWTGPLPVGESVELSYSVTLTGAGDGVVKNVAWNPSDPSDPQPPMCDSSGNGLDPDTKQPCATTDQALPRLSVNKSVDRDEIPAVGAEITYTVVVKNEGPGDYSADAPATVTDDLSDVLDDATFDDASATADVGTVTRDGNTLTWNGPLAAGESATITYSVSYTGKGNQELVNSACVPEGSAAPGFEACDSVSVPGANLKQWKTANPSADTVEAGSTIEYTLFFENDGKAAADINAVDHLTHVLDDATVTAEPTSEDGLTVNRDGEQIAITGSVPAGERYSVTYTVTVLPDSERGDSIATNFLLEQGQTPPADGVCEPSDAELPDCTVTPITGVTYTKSVEASQSPVQEGTELTYTITVTNTGATEVNVNRDDILTDVLDDATMTTDPASDIESVTVEGPTDNVLALRGTLPAGETAHVSYTVTVNAAASRGNSQVNNFWSLPAKRRLKSVTPQRTSAPQHRSRATRLQRPLMSTARSPAMLSPTRLR